ncbi:DNA topoisomerase-3 [Fluviicoccus keumensis]|uniref:DNA topoisomerase n=1 Tax=Fluviicoccus keumensis TaxID=1435465 RepID=A0A4Q7YJ10_9GAMM|nr:DNA topoisomerase 3 [Fluviicoccus keumensis]RZU36753.1 DNA topoisomerase-3 [Fluviicoccus keumensis]
MTTLVIAEKPSVAQGLAKHLGQVKRHEGYLSTGQYLITWCFGHLMELAEPHVYDARFKKWNAADLPILPEQVKVLPKSDKGSRAQLKVIGSLLKDVDTVIHAGDPDREGQLLVDWVLLHCKNRKPVQRIWLAAQDSASIQKAFQQLKSNQLYLPLFQAAQTRAVADWLVGMNLSRAFTLAAQQKGYQGVVSIGRVQTPTLALVVMRDLDIENFVSKTYYVPMMHVGVSGGSFWATWVAPDSLRERFPDGKITDKGYAESLLQLPELGRISLLDQQRLHTAPPLPYRLSRLQKDASARFGLKADEVLAICQSLYEKHKLTSYPRTDCDYLPESQHAEAGSILSVLTTIYPGLSDLLQKADPALKSAAWNDKKVTAHHAIIPVRGDGATVASLSDKEMKVYDLIVRTYVAQFYPPYEYEKTVVEATVAADVFRASGHRPLLPGWKVLFPPKGKTKDNSEEDSDVETVIPAIDLGEPAHNLAVEARQKQTSPPKPYTDGTLIADMESVHRVVAAKTQTVDNKWLKLLKENAGLGTEATRARIITVLLERGFLTRAGKNLIATATGRSLIQALPKEVKSPIATAMMEQELSAIEKEGHDSQSFLQKQREALTRLVVLAAETPIILEKRDNDGSSIERRDKGKSGKSNSRPRKSTAVNEARQSSNTEAPSAKCCPACGKPMQLRHRKSDGQAFTHTHILRDASTLCQMERLDDFNLDSN